MAITVEAIYENGVLKPTQSLPLQERQRVKVTVQTANTPLLEAYGIMGWQGSPEEADSFARGPEFDPLEDS
jgi:predicted DNA-binding antitoxin AbrB/MazE fold protein